MTGWRRKAVAVGLGSESSPSVVNVLARDLLLVALARKAAMIWFPTSLTATILQARAATRLHPHLLRRAILRITPVVLVPLAATLPTMLSETGVFVAVMIPPRVIRRTIGVVAVMTRPARLPTLVVVLASKGYHAVPTGPERGSPATPPRDFHN
jgi:hypothetical protein